MASVHEFGKFVATRSPLPRRLWRFLIAHDVTTATCNSLMLSVERALGHVEIVETASFDHALAELQGTSFDACFVCLDLPPAPLGGARLAREMIHEGLPVILVTRSLRWLPASAPELRDVPWVSPDAPPDEVAKAVHAALTEAAARVPVPLEQIAQVSGEEPLVALRR